MPTTARHRGTYKISARILVVGLWTVLFGMFILFFTVQMMATLSSFSSIGVLGAGIVLAVVVVS
jgi:cell division septal protein FtsQ